MTKKERNKMLLEGCRDGDFDKVRLAINFGADLGAKDVYGNTPLYWASYMNRIAIAKLLIERGADVEAKDNDGGRTPLHFAANWNRIETAKLLIERGADVEAKDKWGQTPLHFASSWNHIEIAELLLDRGADVEAKDDRGKTPLDVVRSNEIRDLLEKYMK